MVIVAIDIVMSSPAIFFGHLLFLFSVGSSLCVTENLRLNITGRSCSFMQLEQIEGRTTKPSQDQLSTRQRCFFLQEPIRTVSIGTDDSVCKQVCRISIFSAHDHNASAPDEILLKETSVGSIVPLTGLKPGDYSVKMNCSSMKTCVSEPDEIRFVVGEQSQQENFMEINLGRIDLYEVKEVAIKEVICKFPRSSWKPVAICMIMLLEALGLKAISWIANRC